MCMHGCCYMISDIAMYVICNEGMIMKPYAYAYSKDNFQLITLYVSDYYIASS